MKSEASPVARVTVYTTDSCPYCVRAKALLSQRGVAYQEVKFGWDEDEKWDALQKRSGMSSVPQIFVRDGEQERLIGGFTELSELDAKEGLEKLK